MFAPDSFKGSATAVAVAAALAEGWSTIRPDDTIALAPMADGGEGTLDAFEIAVPGSERRAVTVTGPDGRLVDASWLALPDGTAVVELANTSGLGLLDPLQPYDAHTTGFGQAIAAALDAGSTRLLLALGGSSSTDGGTGALAVLGARFLDGTGQPVALGGRGLADLVSVDLSALRALPSGGAIVLGDVTNPLLGTDGAAAVFGPQKGATPDDVRVLEAGLLRLASEVDVDPTIPGSGAAGGTGFGLLAWGAAMAPGSTAVGEALGLPSTVRGADVVVTGEGRFDAQSAAGKVPSYLVGLAADTDVPVALVAGSIEAETVGFFAAVSLVDLAGSVAEAMARTRELLVEAGAELARDAPR